MSFNWEFNQPSFSVFATRYPTRLGNVKACTDTWSLKVTRTRLTTQLMHSAQKPCTRSCRQLSAFTYPPPISALPSRNNGSCWRRQQGSLSPTQLPLIALCFQLLRRHELFMRATSSSRARLSCALVLVCVYH